MRKIIWESEDIQINTANISESITRQIHPVFLELDPHKTEYKQMQFLHCCGFSFANKPLPLEAYKPSLYSLWLCMVLLLPWLE